MCGAALVSPQHFIADRMCQRHVDQGIFVALLAGPRAERRPEPVRHTQLAGLPIAPFAASPNHDGGQLRHPDHRTPAHPCVAGSGIGLRPVSTTQRCIEHLAAIDTLMRNHEYCGVIAVVSSVLRHPGRGRQVVLHRSVGDDHGLLRGRNEAADDPVHQRGHRVVHRLVVEQRVTEESMARFAQWAEDFENFLSIPS